MAVTPVGGQLAHVGIAEHGLRQVAAGGFSRRASQSAKRLQ